MPSATRDLPDANLWLALSAATHVHHARARQYWRNESAAELVLCRQTALALVRLLSHGKVLGDTALGGRKAWEALRIWLALPEVSFAAEPPDIDEWLDRWSGELDLRAGDWSDAYLAAFSLVIGCRLVTFDRGFTRFPGIDLLLLRP